MGVDLLPGEHVLWQGSPAHRSVFLRGDPAWMRFSLKFHAVALVLVVAVFALASQWLDLGDLWRIGLAVFVAPEVAHFTEPFVWRFLTLRRTTYFVTDQRVVSVPGRRTRAVRLAEIDNLAYVEEADGSGYVRLDQRIMPDGFGNKAVAELIHVPDVREVVDLISRLTGQTPTAR
ncbi:PH domain-containing protein [Lentzea sp. NPDC054927]